MAGVKGRSGGARSGAGRKPKEKPDNTPVTQPEGTDMLTLLQNVALGVTEATPLQVRAAIAAVQYTHTKRADGGKKEEQKKAALEAGKQGMKNAYEKSKYRPGLTWWERLLWVVLAGAAYAASSLLSGCGHTIDVTAERTEICRDGACLVLEPGRLSYSQAQPETDVPPVVQIVPSKK